MDNYFYEHEAEQFAFIQIPKVLFTGQKYRNMTMDARVLYGLLLYRVKLSKKNKWIDEQGRVYIIFPREEAQEILGCKKDKIVQIYKELRKVDLIEEIRRGLNQPNIIYVKKFIEEPQSQENQWKSEKPNSGSRKNRIQEVGKTDPNNNYRNNTDQSNTTTTNDSNYIHDTIATTEETSEHEVVVVDKSLDQPVKKPTADEIKKVQEIARTEGLKLTKRNIEELWKIADGDLEQIENGIKASVQYATKYEVRNMWGLIRRAVIDGRLPALPSSVQKLEEEIRRKEEKYRDVYVS